MLSMGRWDRFIAVTGSAKQICIVVHREHIHIYIQKRREWSCCKVTFKGSQQDRQRQVHPVWRHSPLSKFGSTLVGFAQDFVQIQIQIQDKSSKTDRKTGSPRLEIQLTLQTWFCTRLCTNINTNTNTNTNRNACHFHEGNRNKQVCWFYLGVLMQDFFFRDFCFKVLTQDFPSEIFVSKF